MLQGVLSTGLGVSAGVLAIALTQFEPRWTVIVAGGVAAATLLICLGSAVRAALVLLASLALTIPVNVSTTLFLYLQAPDQYVPHVGGASGYTISAPLLAALGIVLMQVVTKPEHRIVAELRLEPLTTSGFVLLFMAGVLSLIDAGDAALVGFELARIATLFLIALLIMNLRGEATNWYLHALAFAVLAQGGLALAQYATGSTFGLEAIQRVDAVTEVLDYELFTRPTGTLGNANMLAYFLEITLPLIFALLLTAQRPWSRLLFFAAFAAGFAGIVATLTRGAWISLPVTLGAVFIAFAWRQIWTLKGAMIGVVLSFGIVAAGVVAAPIVIKRITADDSGSADSRAPLNAAAWSMIKQFPVTGVGLNNFGDAFPRYDQHGGSRLLRGPNHVVHNMYLLVWGEIGTIGLAAFLWFFAAAFCVAGIILRHSLDRQDQAIALGVAMGLLAHMVHGLFDPGMRLSFPTSTLVACQIGLLAAIRLRMPSRESAGLSAARTVPLPF